MSGVLRYALVADGGRDRALLPVIRWCIRGLRPRLEVAEPRVSVRGGRDLAAEMQDALDTHLPDILLVHRDAERMRPERRRLEIPSAPGRVVRIVPVRMTEAWLLFDEAALRTASSNPHGRERLNLPDLRRVESLPDPKRVLRELLLAASGNDTMRRRKRFQRDEPGLTERVAECIQDFSPLRCLSAFGDFESDLRLAVEDWERATA